MAPCGIFLEGYIDIARSGGPSNTFVWKCATTTRRYQMVGTLVFEYGYYRYVGSVDVEVKITDAHDPLSLIKRKLFKYPDTKYGPRNITTSAVAEFHTKHGDVTYMTELWKNGKCTKTEMVNVPNIAHDTNNQRDGGDVCVDGADGDGGDTCDDGGDGEVCDGGDTCDDDGDGGDVCDDGGDDESGDSGDICDDDGDGGDVCVDGADGDGGDACDDGGDGEAGDSGDTCDDDGDGGNVCVDDAGGDGEAGDGGDTCDDGGDGEAGDGGDTCYDDVDGGDTCGDDNEGEGDDDGTHNDDGDGNDDCDAGSDADNIVDDGEGDGVESLADMRKRLKRTLKQIMKARGRFLPGAANPGPGPVSANDANLDNVVVRFYDAYKAEGGGWAVDVFWASNARTVEHLQNVAHCDMAFEGFCKWVKAGCPRNRKSNKRPFDNRIGSVGDIITNNDTVVLGTDGLPFVRQTETTACLLTAYANACVRLAGVLPPLTTDRMPLANLSVLDTWTRMDRIIRMGAKVQNTKFPGVYIVIVFTIFQVRHAFIVDSRNTSNPIFLDGVRNGPLPFLTENLRFVNTWSKMYRLEVCNNKNQRKKFKNSWMASLK